jgi:hypothetical protein
LTALVDFSVADPDPGSGMNIFWVIFRELRNNLFKIFKFFDADPGSGNLFDPESGMKKFASGIRDKHPGSATVVDLSKFLFF